MKMMNLTYIIVRWHSIRYMEKLSQMHRNIVIHSKTFVVTLYSTSKKFVQKTFMGERFLPLKILLHAVTIAIKAPNLAQK